MVARRILLVLCAAVAHAQTPLTTEISFSSHDGHAMLGKLTVPAAGARSPVIIYVQTAEGATVDVKRPNGRGGTFNYFDLYREKLPSMGVAFFSYEGRGIRMGDSPPRYEKMDAEVYDTSTLDNKVRDALSAIAVVQKQKGIDPSRIWLMGTSEGTLLAAETASRAPKDVKGLILYSVLASTLKDALHYMASDGAFLVISNLFDTNKDGKVSNEEMEADPRKAKAAGFANVKFDQLDLDKDGFFSQADMRQLRKSLLDAIDAGKFETVYAWLKISAAVSIPKGWLEDHYRHAPMWTFLSPLTIPIGLFHAKGDNLTPVDGTKALEELARRAGKNNMKFQYFEGLDHSLGLGRYFAGGELPDGHKAIFEFIHKQVAQAPAQ